MKTVYVVEFGVNKVIVNIYTEKTSNRGGEEN